MTRESRQEGINQAAGNHEQMIDPLAYQRLKNEVHACRHVESSPAKPIIYAMIRACPANSENEDDSGILSGTYSGNTAIQSVTLTINKAF